MATTVGTFSATSVPGTVETNEQSDTILPADFFPDKFGEKGGKIAARAERDFFIKTYNNFPFLTGTSRIVMSPSAADASATASAEEVPVGVDDGHAGHGLEHDDRHEGQHRQPPVEHLRLSAEGRER